MAAKRVARNGEFDQSIKLLFEMRNVDERDRIILFINYIKFIPGLPSSQFKYWLKIHHINKEEFERALSRIKRLLGKR